MARGAYSRRSFLGGGGAAFAAAALGPVGCAVAPASRFSADPFGLGVASGDPLPDGVVLWTRLAPEPLAADGGMPTRPVPVRWELAEDEGFRRILRGGEVLARPEWAHSVHVEAAGLAPARTYYYRFVVGGVASATGRTRTAPVPGAMPAHLRFASCGCQNYEAGFYTAYGHMAADDLDLVIHTGDYIYEGARQAGLLRGPADAACRTLTDYRLRYGLYKSDPDLRAAHAAHAFAPVFDDHELANDWAGEAGTLQETGSAFAARRAAAFQAWYEHMPVRASSRPADGRLRLHRTLGYGALAEIRLLDTRQYRTVQPCGRRTVSRCGEEEDPRATMLGPDQERWLMEGLARSRARWNVLAQQVAMARMDRDLHPARERFDMDKWDGYAAARRRLLEFLGDARIANPVVLTGDIHRHFAAELHPDFDRPDTPAVAVELTNTSISSNGDGSADDRVDRIWPAQNPHIRFVASQRGYCRHTVTAEAWRTEFQVLDRVSVRGATMRTRAVYTVEAGRPALLTA